MTIKCLNGMFGFLSISGQNRCPPSGHGQNPYAGASSTDYGGFVHQECHPHGKMTKQLGTFYQTVRMILLSMCQLHTVCYEFVKSVGFLLGTFTVVLVTLSRPPFLLLCLACEHGSSWYNSNYQ